jgi:hypothetical protein
MYVRYTIYIYILAELRGGIEEAAGFALKSVFHCDVKRVYVHLHIYKYINVCIYLYIYLCKY